MSLKFEGIRLISINAGYFNRGAAVTIPGLGIITGSKSRQCRALISHEFGHILQYRRWGFIFYWTRIAPASLLSARKANKTNTYNHMDCWTEWSANLLSYRYFGKPENWDLQKYPVSPPGKDTSGLPEYIRQINDHNIEVG
ncbi:MAG: hypothetical protein V1775_06490 [Bacteroidota bacterium]